MQISTSSYQRREQTTFVGRKREQELLLDEIERGAAFISLTGPSGIGKTRLALRVAQLSARFFESEGQTWFCDLSQSQDVVEVESAVARTLRVPQLHGEELTRAIGKRGRMLLVLDNFDSVAGQVSELLGPWLDRCPNLQVIGTSIVPIGVKGEFHFALEPLESMDAVELYMERAHRASVGRVIPEGEAAVVEELVRRLDRIPLAIELASARIRVFPPRALLARLDERLELLRGGEPGRHSSLEDALSLTWSLLTERERLVLSRASVYAGGFFFDAAKTFLDEELQDFEVFELLDGLRAKALLQIEEKEDPRFFLFECTQTFARRMLDAEGEREALRRQRTYLIQRAEEHAAQVEGPNVGSALAWLAAERKNLMVLLHRDWEDAPELAVRVGLTLIASFQREGFPPSTFPALELILRAARKGKDPSQLARVLLALGRSRFHHGQTGIALEHLSEGLDLARAAGAHELTGQFLLELAISRTPDRDGSTVSGNIEEAIQIGKEQGLPALESDAMVLRGAWVASRGEIDEALRCYWRSITILRGNHLHWKESKAWTCYGIALAGAGRLREARAALLEALDRARVVESPLQEAHVLMNLGGLELAAGDLEAAERYSLAALENQRRLEDRRGEAQTLANLGVLALFAPDAKLAEKHLRASAMFHEEANDEQGRALIGLFLAVAQAKVGRLEQGRRTLEEGRSFLSGATGKRPLPAFDLVEGILDVVEAQRLVGTAPKRAEELVRGARHRLEAVQAAGSKENTFEALRLLERDLDHWDERSSEDTAVAAIEPVLIGADGEWFERPGEERVDLRRRMAIRRLLAALVEKRLSAPGKGLAAHELFAAGWPGVEIQQDAAIRRVYIGIWTLRDLGLSDLILNQTDGYLLDHHVPLELQ